MNSEDLHSKGCTNYKKNNISEAIKNFEDALKLDDRIETTFNLGLALIKNRKYDKAIIQFKKVLDSQPNHHEACYCLGVALQNNGDYSIAKKTFEKTLKINKDYKLALKQLNLLMLNSIRKILEDDAVAKKIGEFDGFNNLKKLFEAADRPSCGMNCGSLCCHFQNEMYRYAVVIERDKIDDVKKYLRKNNLDESEYIAKIDLKEFKLGEDLDTFNDDPYIVIEDDVEKIYYPKRKKKKINIKKLENCPKTLEYEDIEWVNESSRPCMFLGGKGCEIHEICGVGLDVCRKWICTPAYVALIAKMHKIEVPRDWIILNNIWPQILKKLFTEIYSKKELIKTFNEIKNGMATKNKISRLNKLLKLD